MKQSKRLMRAKQKIKQNEQMRVERKRGRAIGRSSVKRVNELQAEIKSLDERIEKGKADDTKDSLNDGESEAAGETTTNNAPNNSSSSEKEAVGDGSVQSEVGGGSDCEAPRDTTSTRKD